MPGRPKSTHCRSCGEAQELRHGICQPCHSAYKTARQRARRAMTDDDVLMQRIESNRAFVALISWPAPYSQSPQS
jgi:hypothetical protein